MSGWKANYKGYTCCLGQVGTCKVDHMLAIGYGCHGPSFFVLTIRHRMIKKPVMECWILLVQGIIMKRMIDCARKMTVVAEVALPRTLP